MRHPLRAGACRRATGRPGRAGPGCRARSLQSGLRNTRRDEREKAAVWVDRETRTNGSRSRIYAQHLELRIDDVAVDRKTAGSWVGGRDGKHVADFGREE